MNGNRYLQDEKGSLNGEISKLNEQVSLKREQESRALAEANAGKVVYLTFDDGPSPNTPRIIDILNENGVKATFFVKNGGKYNGYMKNNNRIGKPNRASFIFSQLSAGVCFKAGVF